MRALTIYEELGSCGLVVNLTAACGEEDTTPDLPTSTEAQKDRAHELARSTLNALTAGIVANCPVTVRPCSPRYVASAAGWRWGDLGWTSFAGLGWVSACGCGSVCPCSSVLGLDLNGPVAEVVEVRVGAETLDEGDYRLEGNLLFRTDGTAWPTRQDMDAPLGSADTFSVTYRPGYALGLLGEIALGALYVEWLKSACGQKCRLPVGVTNITRQGVQMTINRSLFHDGLTGMADVDAYIQSVNPHALRSVPTIASPDYAQHRVV
jgi:hypothetical protein